MIFVERKTYTLIAVLFGILASILAVLAVAAYESWIPASYVDNLTSGELGALAALSVVAAIGIGELGQRA